MRQENNAMIDPDIRRLDNAIFRCPAEITWWYEDANGGEHGPFATLADAEAAALANLSTLA